MTPPACVEAARQDRPGAFGREAGTEAPKPLQRRAPAHGQPKAWRDATLIAASCLVNRRESRATDVSEADQDRRKEYGNP